MINTRKKSKTKRQDDDAQFLEAPMADLDNMVVLHSIHMQPAKFPGSDKSCILMYLEDINGEKTKLYAFTSEMLKRIKDMIKEIENDL